MKDRSSERGAVLLMAMVVLIFIVALASMLALLAAHAGKAAGQAARRDALLNAAESGAELALARIATDPAWPGAEAVEVPDGTCGLVVKRLGGEAFEIESRVSRGKRTCVLRVAVKKAADGRFRIQSWETSASPARLPRR